MRAWALPSRFFLLLCATSIVLMAFGSSARAAAPDFTTSTATYAPEPAVAGSVVRYDIAIANTGGDSRYTRIAVALPPGYFIGSAGDCAAAQPGDDDRFVLYEGSFPAGARKHCQVSVLPRPDSAGSIATLAVEITTPPAGYFRLEARPTLAGPPHHPDTVFMGPIGVTPAGMVTLGLLAVAVVGALAVSRRTRGAGAVVRPVGAWIAFVTSIGFLVYFASLAREDWRSYSDYREISCVIVDSSIRAIKGSGRNPSSTYAPEFVVRYDANGTETYSVATPPSTQVSVGWIGSSQKTLERMAIGSTQPCWVDPANVKTVMLQRGPGGAYFFALIPLLMLALAGWMLAKAWRAQ